MQRTPLRQDALDAAAIDEAELQRILVRAGALETVSQELGHFRPDITETYLR